MPKSLAERLKARGPLSPDAWKKAFGQTKAGSDPEEEDTDIIYEAVRLVRQSELAWCLGGVQRNDVWVPKSVATLSGSKLRVPRWWAKKEGWV